MPTDPFDPRPDRDWRWLRRLAWLLIAALAMVVVLKPIVTTDSDRVTVALAPLPAGAGAWLLLHTQATAAGCPRNAVTTFTNGSIEVDRPSSACATERAIFADGFAPSLELTPVWDATAAIALDGMVEVPVRAVGLYAGASAEFDDGLAQANTLYDNNRMGMRFSKAGDIRMLTGSDTQALQDAIVAAQALDAPCGVQIVAEASLFDAASKAIYVFYIGSSQWKLDGESGYTCPGHPNVILVRQGAMPTLLAHELGHSMGLTHSEGDLAPTWPGDTLHKGNVMYGSAFEPGAAPVTDFTLGQAYRANFGEASWLNRSGLRSSPTRSCGSDLNESGPCPYIQLGW